MFEKDVEEITKNIHVIQEDIRSVIDELDGSCEGNCIRDLAMFIEEHEWNPKTLKRLLWELHTIADAYSSALRRLENKEQ